MSLSRSSSLLGLPPRAVKLVGASSSFALSRSVDIAATNADRTESLVTFSNESQFSIIRGDWLVNKSVVVAQERQLAQQKTVVAAVGGAFRVDVSEGAQFLCDPRKLIATLGPVQSRIVYDASRYDLLQTWLRALWYRTAAFSRTSLEKTRRALSRVPVPKSVSSLQIPKLPSLPASTSQYLAIVRRTSSHWWSRACDRLFYYTHAPKLVISGPTSVLVKP